MTATAGVQPTPVGGGLTVGGRPESAEPTPTTPRPCASGAAPVVDPPAGPRPRGRPRAAAWRAGGSGDGAAAPAEAASPVPPVREAALVAACRRGDPGALERLVEGFQAPVVGTVLRLVGDRDAALELANAVFFRLA